jgi:hypothetical protein
MITRILPQEEWSRLEGTEAGEAWPHFNPENTRVIVVEEADEIVGVWVMLRTIHAECLWIAPEHRGSFGVPKRLLREMQKIVSAAGSNYVITGSVSDDVTDLITRLGGVPMPCASFVLPINGLVSRAQAVAALEPLKVLESSEKGA